MDLAKLFLDLVADAAKETAPTLIAKALRDAQEKAKDPIAALAVGMLAGQVEKRGPEVIGDLAEKLANVIDGKNPSAALGAGFDAAALSDLADALQTAEASRRAKVARDVHAFGLVVARVVKFFVEGALKGI